MRQVYSYQCKGLPNEREVYVVRDEAGNAIVARIDQGDAVRRALEIAAKACKSVRIVEAKR
jgi:hypothetical protein